MKKQLLLFISAISLLAIQPSYALKFKLPVPGNDIIGQLSSVQILPGDNLGLIGRQHDIGYFEMREANPQLDEGIMEIGDNILIPSQFILPPAPRKGIVINLAEMRMYYYPENSDTVYTYPVGIGRVAWESPIGVSKITEKVKDPTWYAPKSIREARAKEGVIIPAIVKPGPDNPLGRYKMRLSFPGYLIHSTNLPEGVGMRSSSGCIRMLPTDAEQLFNMVKVGTPVTIINEPYKAGWSGQHLYLEAHAPLQEQEDKISDLNLTPMVKAISEQVKNKLAKISWTEAQEIAEDELGIPELVGSASVHFPVVDYSSLTDNHLLVAKQQAVTLNYGQKTPRHLSLPVMQG
jgi:L,D-transpeptidase ErfK/SrfK